MALDDARGASVGAAGCPPAERLAEYVDGVLAPDDRLAVEAHLADCQDCRDVVYEATRIAQQIGVSAAAAAPAARRRIGTTTWVGLAAAASILLAVTLQPDLLRFGADGAYDDVLTALAGERPASSRLAGFSHAPPRAPLRSGDAGPSPSFEVQAALARAREQAAGSPSTDTLHALGIASLAAGAHDEAVAALERANGDGGSVEIQNDLAAAYLARAEAGEQRDDYARALAILDRALERDPRYAPARFNRALALEGLLLAPAAQTAWKEFLAVEADGPWAAEAREHLADTPPGTP
jgi:tetratricopeptide (TPR) repeat protein